MNEQKTVVAEEKDEESKAVMVRIRVISNLVYVIVGESLVILAVVFDLPYVIGRKVIDRFIAID